MPHYQVGYSVHRDGDQRRTAVLIERRPYWVAAVEAFANAVDALSGHRLCHTLDHVIRFVDRRTDKFYVPCSPEDIAAYSHWRGWGRPHFVAADGTMRPYDDTRDGHTYTRTP